MPPELRNKIYELAFLPDFGPDETVDVNAAPREGLPMACQLLCRESNESYRAAYRAYWNNTFLIKIPGAATGPQRISPRFDDFLLRRISRLRLDFECKLYGAYAYTSVIVHIEKGYTRWLTSATIPSSGDEDLMQALYGINLLNRDILVQVLAASSAKKAHQKSIRALEDYFDRDDNAPPYKLRLSNTFIKRFMEGFDWFEPSDY